MIGVVVGVCGFVVIFIVWCIVVVVLLVEI